MFMVFWIEPNAVDGAYETRSAEFNSDQMVEALGYMEGLRNRVGVRFITMASENPNSVGKSGVAAASADYSWTKRRNNERDPDVAISRRKTYNANDEVEVPLDDD